VWAPHRGGKGTSLICRHGSREEHLPKTPKQGQKKPANPKTARRKRIAAGLAAGKKVAQVAREVGLSRQWASHEAHQLETELLIADLVDREQVRIRALFQNALKVIEGALTADKTTSTKDGDLVDLGPDHYARLQAVKRLLEVALAGRQARVKPPEQVGGAALRTMDDIRAEIDKEPHGRPKRAR